MWLPQHQGTTSVEPYQPLSHLRTRPIWTAIKVGAGLSPHTFALNSEAASAAEAHLIAPAANEALTQRRETSG
jgi:hypothetical protein